jgi:hypothetical protein
LTPPTESTSAQLHQLEKKREKNKEENGSAVKISIQKRKIERKECQTKYLAGVAYDGTYRRYTALSLYID